MKGVFMFQCVTFLFTCRCQEVCCVPCLASCACVFHNILIKVCLLSCAVAKQRETTLSKHRYMSYEAVTNLGGGVIRPLCQNLSKCVKLPNFPAVFRTNWSNSRLSSLPLLRAHLHPATAARLRHCCDIAPESVTKLFPSYSKINCSHSHKCSV